MPPGNQPQAGPPVTDEELPEGGQQGATGAPFQEQDAKRRLGDFESAGEHSFVQPGGNNDAQHNR